MLTAGIEVGAGHLAHEQDDRHHHQPRRDDRGRAADRVRERLAHHPAARGDQHEEERARAAPRTAAATPGSGPGSRSALRRPLDRDTSAPSTRWSLHAAPCDPPPFAVRTTRSTLPGDYAVESRAFSGAASGSPPRNSVQGRASVAFSRSNGKPTARMCGFSARESAVPTTGHGCASRPSACGPAQTLRALVLEQRKHRARPVADIIERLLVADLREARDQDVELLLGEHGCAAVARAGCGADR